MRSAELRGMSDSLRYSESDKRPLDLRSAMASSHARENPITLAKVSAGDGVQNAHP